MSKSKIIENSKKTLRLLLENFCKFWMKICMLKALNLKKHLQAFDDNFIDLKFFYGKKKLQKIWRRS